MQQNDYRMNLRDWLSQIKVRVVGLVLAAVLLPIASSLAWDYWTGNQDWRIRVAVSTLTGGICLALGVWEALRIGRRAQEVGLAADAFANRGDLSQKVSSRGRDELAWTAYSFNRMMKRLNKIAALAERAATGDLTVRIDEKSQDDRLAYSLNGMIANLRDLIGQVVANATSLSAASGQLAAAADQAGKAAQHITITIQQLSLIHI